MADTSMRTSLHQDVLVAVALAGLAAFPVMWATDDVDRGDRPLLWILSVALLAVAARQGTSVLRAVLRGRAPMESRRPAPATLGGARPMAHMNLRAPASTEATSKGTDWAARNVVGAPR